MLLNYAKTNRFNCAGVILIPGNNKVDPKAWKEAKKHPTVQKMLDEGVISEMLDESQVEGKSAKQVDEAAFGLLKTMKQPQALSAVKETVDVELLKEWQKREDRKAVKSALTKQIEAILAPAELRDRSKGRQISGSGLAPQVHEVTASPNASDD